MSRYSQCNLPASTTSCGRVVIWTARWVTLSPCRPNPATWWSWSWSPERTVGTSGHCEMQERLAVRMDWFRGSESTWWALGRRLLWKWKKTLYEQRQYESAAVVFYGRHTLVSDFWWRLSWVWKPGWGGLYIVSPVHDGFLEFHTGSVLF